MSGSSLSPVVCSRAHVLCTLNVFACIEWCATRIDYMSSMAVSYKRQEMLSLNGPLGSPSICGGVRFANRLSFLCCIFVLFVFVMCLVYAMLSVSLDCPFFIAPSVFSRSFIFYCPFGFL